MDGTHFVYLSFVGRHLGCFHVASSVLQHQATVQLRLSPEILWAECLCPLKINMLKPVRGAYPNVMVFGDEAFGR